MLKELYDMKRVYYKLPVKGNAVSLWNFIHSPFECDDCSHWVEHV